MSPRRRRIRAASRGADVRVRRSRIRRGGGVGGAGGPGPRRDAQLPEAASFRDAVGPGRGGRPDPARASAGPRGVRAGTAGGAQHRRAVAHPARIRGGGHDPVVGRAGVRGRHAGLDSGGEAVAAGRRRVAGRRARTGRRGRPSARGGRAGRVGRGRHRGRPGPHHRRSGAPHRATRDAGGPPPRPERHRDDPGRGARAVRLEERRRRLLARALQGRRERVRHQRQRVPRVVPAPLVPPVGDADDRAARADRDRLDDRAAVPARHHAVRVVRGSARTVPTRGAVR